jgi:hypothetical protein
MKQLLGESWRTTTCFIAGLIGIVFLIWIALAYNQLILLAALVPLLPAVFAALFARDQQVHEESKRP